MRLQRLRSLAAMGLILLLLALLQSAGAQSVTETAQVESVTKPEATAYWLFLKVDSLLPDAFDQQAATVGRLLAEKEREGVLASFAAVAELHAFQLIAPDNTLLAEAVSWPGVAEIRPDTTQVVEQRSESLHGAARSGGSTPFRTHAPTPQPPTDRPSVESAQGLTSFHAYIDEFFVEGDVDTPNVAITLTLKTGSVIKSQVQTVSSGTYFNAYFSHLILGGDTIEVDIVGEPLIVVNVAPLTIDIDKETETFTGTGLPNTWVIPFVFSYFDWQWHSQWILTDGSGNFSADFSTFTDIFLGDGAELWYYDANGYRIVRRNFRVHGFSVDPSFDYIYGYAAPLQTVNLTLKDGSGNVKGTVTPTTGSDGYFYSNFTDPAVIDIALGDKVEFQYGTNPVQVVQVEAAVLNLIDPVTDLVQGIAPPGGKVEVGVTDSYQATGEEVLVTSSATGVFSADFTGIVDILPGTYAWANLHDAQDNELSIGSLYAGPFVKVNLNSYTDLFATGLPGEQVHATLRNSLGAIKGTASGSLNDSGYAYISFYDSIGNNVDPLAGDAVEVIFTGSGVTKMIVIVDIDYIIDRDARLVYGTGPANSSLRLIYNGGWETADVTTDSNGNFSHTFSSTLTGGYWFNVDYRNSSGDDISVDSLVPQFTASLESGYLYGYGPPTTAVVATLKDNSGNVKDTRNTTTSYDGWYSIYFYGTLEVDDEVIVDVGPLHYQQTAVPLTIAADTVNNVVYGTAPPQAWLNVFARNYFGPYYTYNYRYFYADVQGNYTTAFPEVRGGDSLEVIYWEDGVKDRIRLNRTAPYLQIEFQNNFIFGYTTAGATGPVTLRDSSGNVKAIGTVSASLTSGYYRWDAPAGVNIVPGDEVEIHVGAVNQISPVIPMDATLDAVANTVSGVSLPNDLIGVSVLHWTGSYFSTYVNGLSLQGFATTNPGGNFNLDYSGLVDLEVGDYVTLYYIDTLDTYYRASFFTTSPTVTVDSYPVLVQPYAPVEIQYSIANGAHPTGAYIRWDTESHANDNLYSYSSSWQQGVIGTNISTISAPGSGTIYFKAYVYIDGQTVWSNEHSVDVDGVGATTLFDPVSGTTNDTTPTIHGLAAPNAAVELFEASALLGTATADGSGYFSLNLAGPLSPGTHALHAVATVGGVSGPDSNVINLTIDPTLLVDPVHILVTHRGQTQHLRDDSGLANLGGRIWTRTGETVGISIPISYTTVYTADLYVGGVLATPLLNSGSNVFVGTYDPPTTGAYSVDLKFRGGGPAGTIYTINILTGLIDPDGYVYNADLGPDYRVAGATVTCYQLVNGAWIVWNGQIWGQANPQTVGADGYYAFFTLPGDYKITVTADGYEDYESPVLTVIDEPVHHNVPLERLGLEEKLYLPVMARP